MKVVHYPYLNDKKFLKEFDQFRNKEQFVKIVVLTWKEEKAIAEIQGRATGGSISANGKSSVRRTASLSVVADEELYDITNVRNLIAINKKMEIEVGFSNFTDQYTEYPILWFPQGVYVTQDASISENTSGITISLQLADKMCMLNGQCGGTFAAAIDFTPIRNEDGTEEPVQIYQIIRRAVEEFGGEDPGRIIINDIDTRIKKVEQWIGDETVYLESQKDADNHTFYFLKRQSDYAQEVIFKQDDRPDPAIKYFADKKGKYLITAEEIEEKVAAEETCTVFYFKDVPKDAKAYQYGDDIGFSYTDFTYNEQLVCQPGENVVTVLDKIKNTLGNYEYFYDLYGNFIFQEIKNYLNTTQATFDLNQGFSASQYLINDNKGKSVYTFEDGSLITSYSCNPQFGNIKNDYVVWGQRSKDDTSNAGNPVHYHLAIDTKPISGNFYHVILKKADVSADSTLMRAEPITVIPILNQNEFNEKYKDLKVRDPAVWYHFNKSIVIDGKDEELPSDDVPYKSGYYHYSTKNNGWVRVPDEEAPKIVKTYDWREELYFKGMIDRQKNIYSFYNEEMAAFWPLVFDEVAEVDANASLAGFNEKVYKGSYRVRDPRQLDFYIDFIDTTGTISDYHVDNIGRRTYAVSETSINCLFAPEVPNFILIPVQNVDSDSDSESEEVEKLRKECQKQGQPYIQIATEMRDAISTGGTLNPAYNYIRNILYQFLTYNESINISVIPIYYLEPNTRISIVNKNLGINGDYMIDSYSLPLDTGGTMSLNCSKALERI